MTTEAEYLAVEHAELAHRAALMDIALTMSNNEKAAVIVELDDALETVDQVATQRDGLADQLHAANVEIARLTKLVPPPVVVVPPPVVVPPVVVPPAAGGHILLGACPIAGGTNLQPVITKWGRNPTRTLAGRVFMPGEWKTFARPSIEDMPMVVVSCKPAANLTTAQLEAIGAVLTSPLDTLVLWHENDVKHKGGSYSTAEMDRRRAMQADATTKVRALREAKRVAYRTGEVYGGWRLQTAHDIDMYIPDVVGDVLILDIDGTSGGTVYQDWAAPKVMAEIQRIQAGPYKGKALVFGEYAWGATTNDADRTKRVAAINAQVPKLLTLKPEALIAFDFNNFAGEAFEKANEIAALKAAVPV